MGVNIRLIGRLTRIAVMKAASHIWKNHGPYPTFISVRMPDMKNDMTKENRVANTTE